MPSTYTQNLGIEEPATGEQANTWGLTVNRNMETLDTAINGNIHLPLSSSPYQLTINNGSDKPTAANPVIIWTGQQSVQGEVRIDYQSSRQHFYCMSNQTSGGFAIAFTQGTGSQFVLQAGYDALIYSDGGGLSANVAAALGSPQFVNLLATGAAQVNGALTVNGSFKLGAVTIAASGGNVLLTGGLGVGNPAAIDLLTINGLGAYGQLRMVYGAYGVFFRNDGQSLYLMVTAANDPYGTYVGNFPIFIDLATRNVGMAGWGPSASYGLNVPSIHASGITADGDISAGNRLVAGQGVTNNNGRSYFKSGDQYQIALSYGTFTNYIGTNPSNQFQLSNVNGSSMLAVDASGNAAFAGGVHSLAGGFQFPDGTIQTTAAFNYVPPPPTGNFPGNISVGGVITGPGSSSFSPALYCFPFGSPPSAPPHSVLFSHNEGGNWVTIWVFKSDGSRWAANINLGPVG